MDDENENNDNDDVPNKRKKKDLTTKQIYSIISCLLEDLVVHHGEKVPRPGRMRLAAQRFGVSKRTVARKWARAKANRANGHIEAYTA